MRGSVTKYVVKDKTTGKVKYRGYRAQVPDPRRPTGSAAKLHKKFPAPAHGGIANAHEAAEQVGSQAA